MALTVSEKDHFRKRIRESAKALADSINARELNWQRDLRKIAADQIKQELGLEELLNRREEIEARRETLHEKHQREEAQLKAKQTNEKVVLKDEQRDITNEIMSKLNGYEQDDSNVPTVQQGIWSTRRVEFTRYPGDSGTQVKQFIDMRFQALLHTHPLGQQLIALEKVRAEAEDAITTAGTHKQLHDVWEGIKEQLQIVEKGGESRQPRKVKTERKTTTTTTE